MQKLTSPDSWEKGYRSRGDAAQLSFGWRFRSNELLRAEFEALGLGGLSVLEVGAGDSQWLPYLAARHPEGRYVGLDYSAAGCERLARRAQSAGLSNIDIVHADLFDPPESLVAQFDLVYSLGVVEHFSDLPRVLAAKARFAKPGGRLLTSIPNMAGTLGRLTRILNREVYDMHMPHDLASFQSGHRAAGLELQRAIHLATMDYGALSSCITSPRGWRHQTYLWLSRASKLVALFEDRIARLPSSGLFSPHLVVVSRRA